MNGLWQWLKKRTPWPIKGSGPSPDNYPLLCPEIPLAIIGDIHGRADLLDKILANVSQEAPKARSVFVGDYVDRGPQSAAVLTRLRSLSGAVCIRGNHETMLLEFLENPIETGGRWLRNGGSQTLASYGIELAENSGLDEIQAAQQELKQVLADGSEKWLRGLPLFWRSGNLLITHAGPDPAKSIKAQDDKNFLWGHPRFLRDERSDGLWVAHGHWVRDRPDVSNGRINVDTGAYKTGRLTAALVSKDGQIKFIQARTKGHALNG